MRSTANTDTPEFVLPRSVSATGETDGDPAVSDSGPDTQ